MTEDYARRFGGVGRLLGAAALERLAAARVCVVGLGGVGSWAAEALARSGVGGLTLVDMDDVCVTNTNRQLPAVTGAEGRPKARLLRERALAINPGCDAVALELFFSKATAGEVLDGGFDCVVDAIDTTGDKALLIAECGRRGLGCVTVGGAGGKRDATQIRAGDLGEARGDELLRLVRRKLRREHGYPAGEGARFGARCVFSAERPAFPWADGVCRAEPERSGPLRLDCEGGLGAAAFVTGAFGLVAAQEAVRLVTAGCRGE
ncbi:MAG: tRNA threonylcarbamoyladenosine dehydratase [Opitutaceae bacterium]|nr:tRNA threonylcarbamoyladenosine dehydratase [Opitutaceae bacterium]